MAARTRIGLAPPADLHRRQRGAGRLHWILALLAVATGIFDPGSNAAAGTGRGFWQDLHPLFGCLLLALIISEFYWHAKNSRNVSRAELREFSRRLARNVLLLVYLVVFAKQTLVLLGPPTLRAGALGNHLGGYVACAAAALVTVRLLGVLVPGATIRRY